MSITLKQKEIKEIADTLFQNTITATLGANFDRKYCSVITGSEKRRFLKGYLHFLLLNHSVNNECNITCIWFLNITAFPTKLFVRKFFVWKNFFFSRIINVHSFQKVESEILQILWGLCNSRYIGKFRYPSLQSC